MQSRSRLPVVPESYHLPNGDELLDLMQIFENAVLPRLRPLCWHA